MHVFYTLLSFCVFLKIFPHKKEGKSEVSRRRPTPGLDLDDLRVILFGTFLYLGEGQKHSLGHNARVTKGEETITGRRVWRKRKGISHSESLNNTGFQEQTGFFGSSRDLR